MTNHQQYAIIRLLDIRSVIPLKHINKINLLTIFITMVLIVGLYSFSINRINQFHTKQTYEAMLEQKKVLIKEGVDNQIIRIEKYKDSFTTYFFSVADRFIDRQIDSAIVGDDLIYQLSQLESIIPNAFSLHLVENGITKYELGIPITSLDAIEADPRFYQTNIYTHQDYLLFLGVNKDYVDERVFVRIKEDILSQSYDKDTYMWINQILDYDGGDDYAIRFIHPNSNPPTGTLLSTNTEVYGKKPYQIELDGIKEDGDVYFTYHFKLPDSEVLAEKITYAKLYEPYDFVVAMGIYIEDITEYSNKNRQAMLNYSFEVSIGFVIIFVLATITNYIYISKANQKRNQEEKETIIKISNTDQLTGAYLRRVAVSHFDLYLKNNAKKDGVCAFILFDIDHFKQINDRFGHKMGDVILQDVTKIIKEVKSLDNRIYRWGGDEFVFLLRKESKQALQTDVETLIKTINKYVFKSEGKQTKITISIGITLIKETDQSIDELIVRSDKALYESKNKGRNRYTIIE